ncbi:hypothetical protein GCM10011428_02090 [Streptomyces violaceus]|uniref:hypothetical protein n=1 Tax=Streptomyces violaceus TaxID=1936 RepID=UPI0031EE64ED
MTAAPPPTVTDARRPVPGEIPADSDVPEALRPVIARAAHRCTDEEITPVLLAALIKAESGFDADAARPQSEEYGIAMWTPSVFRAWAVDGDGDGDKDHMSPPDAIATMSLYVCWLDPALQTGRAAEEGPSRAGRGRLPHQRPHGHRGGAASRLGYGRTWTRLRGATSPLTNSDPRAYASGGPDPSGPRPPLVPRSRHGRGEPHSGTFGSRLSGELM